VKTSSPEFMIGLHEFGPMNTNERFKDAPCPAYVCHYVGLSSGWLDKFYLYSVFKSRSVTDRRDGEVCIATGYGLDGQGSSPCRDKNFLSQRLGPS
jgi:hypothetical protein